MTDKSRDLEALRAALHKHAARRGKRLALLEDLRALVEAAAREGTWYAREASMVAILRELDTLPPETKDTP